jgi:hypothetical protein
MTPHAGSSGGSRPKRPAANRRDSTPHVSSGEALDLFSVILNLVYCIET